MLIAAGPNKAGRNVLYIGLGEINMTRLRADIPIYRSLDPYEIPGLAGWDLCVMGPEDMTRFQAAVGALLQATTRGQGTRSTSDAAGMDRDSRIAAMLEQLHAALGWLSANPNAVEVEVGAAIDAAIRIGEGGGA